MRIVVACTFVPFSVDAGRRAALSIAAELRANGSAVTVSALPIEPDPSTAAAQCTWIRLLRLDRVADRLICLGEPAALLTHRDKRVWLANAFEDLGAPEEIGVSYEIGLGEAALLACEPGHREAGRPGAVTLAMPSSDELWRDAALRLAR